jgi:excinuclease ABC subunit A
VRVDGDFHHVDDDITMERYVKHDIDVVVDRIVVKAGVEKRLTDSVETALKLGKGLLRIYYEFPGEKPQEMLQSEQFACVECGIAYEELEPRMFSFNNPHGACPRCTGLGQVMEVDPELVVPDASVSIHDGAVRPWSIRRVLDGMYRKALKSVCAHYGVSEYAPWNSLT